MNETTTNVDKSLEEFAARNARATRITNLLIIDYDVTRYHSFDMLRYLLMDREFFMALDPSYSAILDPKLTLAEQVDFVRHKVDKFNPYDLFTIDSGVKTVTDYESKLNAAFANSGMMTTPTGLHNNLSILLDRSDITGYIVRYKNDPHKPEYIDSMTVFESDNIMNIDYLTAIIQQYHINAIMIANIEMAIKICISLVNQGYREPITFMIARYAYNLEEVGFMSSGPKYISEMNILEYSIKHEFGFYDPYSALTYQNKVNEEFKDS